MTDLPWHRRDPSAYRRVVQAVEREFPGLRFEERDGRLLLAGEFQVAGAGEVLDLYQLEIEIPRAGPRSGIPVVRELGGRIPPLPDRHINADGTACLGVPDELHYRHPHGLDLLDFLRGPVLGFFVGQSIVAAGGAWPYGERPHGAAGIVAFYGPLLGTSDPRRVRALLEVLGAKKPRSHWPCPCGGGRRLSECHNALVGRLRARIPRSVARAAEGVLRREASHGGGD